MVKLASDRIKELRAEFEALDTSMAEPLPTAEVNRRQHRKAELLREIEDLE